MFKALGVMLGGVFVGAVGVVAVRRIYPEAMEKLYARTQEIASAAKEAFKEGYRSAARTRDVAEPST